MVGERKARKTDAWMMALAPTWRRIPRRGLAMISLRFGVRTGWGRELGCEIVLVSRLDTESRRRERAADQLWRVASVSPKPPMKRWRAEAFAMPLGVPAEIGVSLSVARMSRTSAPMTRAMGESANAASEEAPSSWVRTRCRRVRVSEVRVELIEEKLWR